MPPSTGSTATSQSLERGLAILSSFHLRPAADRRQRALARARPEPEHGAPLHRDARQARLPAAGPRLEALPARPEGARPRLLGDQLDGRARDLRAAPATAQRRDGAHGQPRDPRRRSTSSTSSAAAPRSRASGRSTSTSTSAHGCRAYCTAMGKAILAFVPEDASARSSSRRIDFAPRGPNTLTDPHGVPGGARTDPRLGHRRERRGARVRSAVDRRADPLALGRGARRAQPRRPPHDGVDGRADRALRPAVVKRTARRHLAQHGTRAGARLMAARANAGVLWTPPPDVRETTEIGRYLAWLERERGLAFAGYEACGAGRSTTCRRSGRRSGSSSR